MQSSWSVEAVLSSAPAKKENATFMEQLIWNINANSAVALLRGSAGERLTSVTLATTSKLAEIMSQRRAMSVQHALDQENAL
mmetsp:Transcript_39147/g.76970  ORF Transcript_39147/g.76970 Transcript_39147/m.76970 type:complete len:82 (-) Transcript_39147:224-469(-)